MARTLLVWGCSSGAGKSWLATALARIAARRGIDAVPFKAQNMSNNARVVPCSDDGAPGEIGAAQYFQALAARVVPETDHNPVLLKPESETASQVVVHGRADAALSRRPWRERSGALAAAAEASFARLSTRHALVIVEGAGSPAEINLAAQDYVNLGVARWAAGRGALAALLVADIDRGGAFAHAHGTWALLPEDLRGHLAGFVFNRFRGDAGLLAPGPAQLEALTGVPLVGVLPMLREHGLPEEDGRHDGWAASRGPGPLRRRVAVLAPPAISNLDEFAPLAQLPGVELRWAREEADCEGVDWILLPGSKHTLGDLAWLRARGLDAAVRRHAAAGGAVLGVCGGLQMLGRTLADPEGHDGQAIARAEGLGLLALETRFEAVKQLRQGALRFDGTAGPWSPLDGVATTGYEIRAGHSRALDPATRPVLFDDQGHTLGWQRGAVLGVYAHGLFEQPAVLQALFGGGSDPEGPALPTLDAAFDRIADHVERHLDPAVLERLLVG